MFIVIFCYTGSAQSQLSELTEFISKIDEADSLLSYVQKKNFESVKTSYKWSWEEQNRNVDFNFKHHRIAIGTDFDTKYKVNFLSKNGKIVVGWISTFDEYNDEIISTDLFRENTQVLDNYTSLHNSFYQTNLTSSEIVNQITMEYEVALGCGYSGNYVSKASDKMLKYVKRNNKRKLNNFLKSFSPELQTLGAIGLLKLGILNDEQIRIISHLEQRNSTIYSCSGCLSSNDKTFADTIAHLK